MRLLSSAERRRWRRRGRIPKRVRTILIAGPDGAGKSTVKEALVASLKESKIESLTVHSRPGILFSSRSRNRRSANEPHSLKPRGQLLSSAKVLAVFVDYIVADLTTWRAATRRGVVILERGWHDMMVDPRRYRLSGRVVPLVAFLGRFLPKHDLAVVLGGSPAVLHARKHELSEDEIGRQLRVWDGLASTSAKRQMYLDTTRMTAVAVVSKIQAMLSTDEGARWVRSPITSHRLSLDVLASRESRAAMRVYRPLLPRARLAFRVNRFLAARGLARTIDPPIDELNDLARLLGVKYSGAAAFQSSSPGRHVIGLSDGGELTTVIKIGGRDDTALIREAEVLLRLNTSRLPVLIPEMLWAGEWRHYQVLAVIALADAEPASIELETVAELSSRLLEMERPLVHGDLAPWNVLNSSGRTYLIDWEHSLDEFKPLFDLAHYAIRSGALLGSFDPCEALVLLSSPGSPGVRHLERLNVDPSLAPELITEYISKIRSSDPLVRMYEDAVLAELA